MNEFFGDSEYTDHCNPNPVWERGHNENNKCSF